MDWDLEDLRVDIEEEEEVGSYLILEEEGE